MGRIKRFDEQHVLDQIMLLFWQHGYEATTYSLLERETGVSGRSLINAFGDKDALFLLALDRYHRRMEGAFQQTLRPAGVEGIKRFFAGFQGMEADDPRGFGCLMVNTVAAAPGREVEVAARIRTFRDMLLERFEQALARDGIPDAKRKAGFLVGMVWGIGVELRLGGHAAPVTASVAYARRTVDGWKRVQKAG